MTRVLVVDDDAANRELLRVLLTAHGYEVDEACHGQEALQMALARPPDLLVTDLLMPEMDGYALLQHWRAEASLRNRPALVYTATYTDPRDEALALHMGADDFLVKPMEPQAFMERLVRLLQAGPAGGPGAPPGPESREEEGTLRLYNEVLVRKLESKSRQLEAHVADLTAAKQQVERLSRRHAVLSAASQAIVHATDRVQLLETVCRVAVEQGGASAAWVGLLDAGRAEVMPVAWWGQAQAWLQKAGPFKRDAAPRSPVELAVASGATYLCHDVTADPRLAPLHDAFRQAGLRSAGSCPLRIDRDIVGALTLLSAEPGFFEDFSAGLLEELGTDLSFALANFEKEALRREADEELVRLNADLERRIQDRTAELTQANEELRTFSYSVSHDLRSPLSAISGFTARVLAEPGLQERPAQLLRRVLAAADRMAQLIDDLLALAHVSQRGVERQACDVSALAHAVVDALRAAQPQRQVQVEVAAGLRAVADPGLVRIALENLIGNAWKFTARAQGASVQVGREPHQGQFAFFVRDNGDGFDMAHAGSLLSPFQRLHKADEFEGTGIGLSIVQRIVRKHGGTLMFDAAPQRGATFWFTLGDSPAGPASRPDQAAGR